METSSVPREADGAALIYAALSQLSFADVAPRARGRQWERDGLPATAKRKAEQHWRDREAMEGDPQPTRDKLTMLEYSPFETLTLEIRAAILERFCPLVVDAAAPRRSVQHDRGIGALIGLAVGDSVGAPLEQVDAVDAVNPEACVFRRLIEEEEPNAGASDALTLRMVGALPTALLQYSGAYNEFELKPGQWTDDTSQALCLVDSLLKSGRDSQRPEGMRGEQHGEASETDESEETSANKDFDPDFDPRDLRARFYCWWEFGYNNGFAFDPDRQYMGPKFAHTSVGLGGNTMVSLITGEDSIHDYWSVEQIPPYVSRKGDEAGNGVLMRLAPVALRFSLDVSRAMRVAALQSFTTHPAGKAADAARFLVFVLVRAIERPIVAEAEGNQEQKVAPGGEDIGGGVFPMQVFLDGARVDFLAHAAQWKLEGSHLQVHTDVIRVVDAEEPENGTEANWNWRSAASKIGDAHKARQRTYNGHPNSLDYWGSYSLDGLALALHACYWSRSFEEAVFAAVNHLGDADTTGAIAGQIAGAFYGFANGIPKDLVAALERWDDGMTVLRGALLVGLQDTTVVGGESGD